MWTDMKEKLLALLQADCPWRGSLHWYARIDSTNDRAKELAEAGAPHGTVVLAGQQDAGRGRMGRHFHSPAGQGIYLSAILRPQCPAKELLHLTCAVAVAMCDAVEEAAGFRPGIKWINDLVFQKKKLGGILTELSIDPQTGLVTYAVVGIGLNCGQSADAFPEELREIASSLRIAAGRPIPTETVAASMIRALARMDETLLSQRDAMLCRYRADCVTLGQEVVLLRAGDRQYGKALDIDGTGNLLVEFPDGVRAVGSGEVSVRGMYGYL